ncbi:protein TIPIN homolog [Bombus terrestris]|uniref:TIMELESS-interacting protein n=1 Tax=Bombus terrestris TaxID=30195 RepID=A0A9B2JZ12_BOMTE|nr:protein TIPIN homolog [Bombus terrestris]
MTTLSNTSDYDEEDEHDIIAEYENQESDGDQGNVQKNSDSENDQSKEENAVRRIDPSSSKKHIVRNPLPKLNTERLKGPKGIHTIEKYFEGFKFHGQGYEKLDLDRVMKRLEHWGHRLFPKLDFDDFLERLEKLGTKKDLQVFIRKYRQDMINEDNDIINEDNIDVEENIVQDEPIDEFDLLIAEQIEKQKQVMQQTAINVPTTNNDVFDKLLSQSNTTNSQSVTNASTSSHLSDEVKARIERNRQQAIQRRLARFKEIEEEIKRKKLKEPESNETERYAKNNELKNNSQKTDKSHEI